MTKTLNHARARELSALLTKTALTRRAQIEVDERTNTLIITDLQAGLDRATRLIETLDAPQLQVEIEARIVRTTKVFARELGIKWGFFGQATPEFGNTLPTVVPESGRGQWTAARSCRAPARRPAQSTSTRPPSPARRSAR